VKLSGLKVEGLPETRSDNDMTSLRMKGKEMSKEVSGKLAFSALYAKNVNESQLKLQTFNMAIELVDTAADLWKLLPGFPELISPTKEILSLISKSKLHSSFPIETKVHSPGYLILTLDPSPHNPRNPLTKNKTLPRLSSPFNPSSPSTHPHPILPSKIHHVTLFRL